MNECSARKMYNIKFAVNNASLHYLLQCTAYSWMDFGLDGFVDVAVLDCCVSVRQLELQRRAKAR